MQSKVTQSEIIRFLAKTEGYLVTAGKEARVYGGNTDIQAAAYSIPSAMLTAMVDEQLIELIKLPTGNRRYILTEKGLRVGMQTRGLSRESENSD